MFSYHSYYYSSGPLYKNKDEYPDTQVEEFPMCCGINVIGEMNDTNMKEVTHEKVLASIKEAITDCKDHNKGLVLYTTIATENRKEIKALKELDFKVLSKFFNPNSGNWVTLWGLKVSQPSARKRKARS